MVIARWDGALYPPKLTNSSGLNLALPSLRVLNLVSNLDEVMHSLK